MITKTEQILIIQGIIHGLVNPHAEPEPTALNPIYIAEVLREANKTILRCMDLEKERLSDETESVAKVSWKPSQTP